VRGKRTRLATGIYKDAHGVAIIMSVQGAPVEHRYPLGKTLAWYIAERGKLQSAAELQAERRIAKWQTFEARVDDYLETLSGTHARDARLLLAKWSGEVGDRVPNEITTDEIDTQLNAWNKAASTRNHLRQALIGFYRYLNGPSGYNPAKLAKKAPERYHDARGLPYATIAKILQQLQPSKSRARLLVMAYTGLPQAQIARLTPDDVRLTRKAVYVRPRRKGAGVPGRMLPLSPAGIAAFKEFIAQDAFGSFARRQLGKVWKGAVLAAGVTLPPGARPYDLRHSFLTEVYRRTGDLNAVAELGMHATLEQTARYARAAVSERAKKAVAAVPRFPLRGTSPRRSGSFQSGRKKSGVPKGGVSSEKHAK
jgi:integrase